DQTTRMRKVEMTPATARPAFDRYRQAGVLALEVLQTDIAAMPQIEIDHDEARDGTGHDTDPGVGPCAKPAARLLLTGAPELEFLPADERALVPRPDRDDRPASSDVVVDRLIHRSHQVSRSTTSKPCRSRLP